MFSLFQFAIKYGECCTCSDTVMLMREYPVWHNAVFDIYIGSITKAFVYSSGLSEYATEKLTN